MTDPTDSKDVVRSAMRSGRKAWLLLTAALLLGAAVWSVMGSMLFGRALARTLGRDSAVQGAWIDAKPGSTILYLGIQVATPTTISGVRAPGFGVDSLILFVAVPRVGFPSIRSDSIVAVLEATKAWNQPITLKLRPRRAEDRGRLLGTLQVEGLQDRFEVYASYQPAPVPLDSLVGS